MKKCIACNKGLVICHKCRGGTAELPCTECESRGYGLDVEGNFEDCDRCNGDGYLGADECDECFGTRKLDCSICHGQGELEDDDCYACASSQQVKCVECNGNGEVTCEECEGECSYCDTCNGIGRDTCGTCAGDGLIECNCCNN